MILINGNFLCRNLTGIERFAFETCRNLDLLLQNDDISILVPANARSIPDFKKIKIIRAKKTIKSFPLWDMGFFARTCKELRATALDFSNTAPLGKSCGIAFLHDIYAASRSEDFISLKDRMIRFYSKISYHNITKNAKLILTVSNFSKSEIQKIYKIPDEKIRVVPNGWDHFKTIETNEKIFEKFPQLKEKDFYFTLGSLSKRKNLRWIASYAEKHHDEMFAVSGKAISGLVAPELASLQNLKNVALLGYVADGEVKALMQKCKAFIFPSYYEGFGIPPLEALSCGAQVIVSNITSLTEIYGKTAHYIDPFNTDCNLAEILKEPVESPATILEKFTYKNAAKKLYALLSANGFV